MSKSELAERSGCVSAVRNGGKMTKAQRKWLDELKEKGFVEMGGWGNGQKNGPLWKLCEMGLAKFGWGPPGSYLQTQGFMLK